MEQDDLLSTLRKLEPLELPDYKQQMLQHQACLTNLLEDIKLKQAITNELLLELVEQGKQQSDPNFGVQARLNRFRPAASQIRRLNGNNSKKFGSHGD